MNQLLGMTTEWVADLVFDEYQFASLPNSIQKYTFSETEGSATVVRDGRQHHVVKATWLCDCEFSATLLLPCRHVLLYRKQTGSLFTIPYASIKSRWLRAANPDVDIPVVDAPLRILTSSDDAARKRRMTEKDQFRRAQNVLGRISSELAEFTDASFNSVIDNLKTWWENLRQGKADIGAEISMDVEDNEDPGDSRPVTPRLKPFNERAPKVGRPRINRADVESKRKQDQRNYNQGKRLRKALREKDILQVAEYIKENKPPLAELRSFLGSYEVHYMQKKKPVITVETGVPSTNHVVAFRLCIELVTMALEAIKKVDSVSVVDVDYSIIPAEVQHTVQVEGAGEFSGSQILAMSYLGNLTKTCNEGMLCYSWIMTSIDPLMTERASTTSDAVQERTEAESVAHEMMATWPYTSLPGFGFSVRLSNLYCAREDAWYNDFFIEAFAKTLAVKYGSNTTIPLPRVDLPDKNKGERVPEETRAALLQTAPEDYIFMPLKINGNHWVCIVVDKGKSIILCYDSIGKRTNQKLLQEVASEIIDTTLTGFAQTPMQKDGSSCGLFVCLFFWKRLWKEAGNDYSHLGL